MLSSCTKSGTGTAVPDGHEAALNVVLTGDGKLEHEAVVHETTANLFPMNAALMKLKGHGNDLPSEPQSSPQAMKSPERKCWEAAEKTEVRPQQQRNLDEMPAP